MNTFHDSNESDSLLASRHVIAASLRLLTGDVQEVERVQELLQLLQLILDNIPQAVFWKNRDSIYVGCNRSFAIDAGVADPHGIVGKTDYDLAWTKEEADFFCEVDRRVMESGEPERHLTERQTQADGKVAYLDTNKVPLYGADGHVVGMLGTYEDITERLQAEEAIRAHEQAVRAERQRLARDLHDAVSQTLWTASLIADVLPTLWLEDHQEALDNLGRLRRLTRGALAEMRTLLMELRPSALVEARFNDLIRHLAEASMSRKRIDISLALQGQCKLPPDVQVSLYRMAQEVLNNIVKHSKATQVAIHLVSTKQSVDLRIQDNGTGFDLNKLAKDRLGIQIIQERADSIGASVAITSKISKGTEVVIQWPNARGGDK